MAPKILIAVGTYEGVLAGWQLNKKVLKIQFATPVHGGSVRGLSIAKGQEQHSSILVSSGYDEYLRTHDLHKKLTSSGEIRTSSDFGTPVCCSFAPPYSIDGPVSTHCLVGFSNGKLAIYKKRDWSVQHVLAGHEGGIASMAVHPSGKMALSGGESDGKLSLWDLTKGRLAYVTKIQPAHSNIQGRTRYDAIASIVWQKDGEAYGFCYGSHVTVRDVASGKDLLDVELPSRVNQICFMPVEEGLFLVAACNDGSLPVLAVQNVDDEEEERRAIMAIEPVEGPVAGEERFKCVQHVYGYHVATANSAGVVSLMNLKGAVNMIMSGDDEDEEEKPVAGESDSDDENGSDNEEEELAVDIIDSVQLGTGARITCLVACASGEVENDESEDEEEAEGTPRAQEEEEVEAPRVEKSPEGKKRKRDINMDPEAVERARKLVAEAKKIQKKKRSKK